MALTDLIIKNVSTHIKLEEEEKAIFLGMLRQQHVKRKQLLLREGETCRVSSFVVSGCLRGYTVDADGTEHVLNFAPPNWWIADMYSLLSQKPGTLNIEALEDTEMLTLSKADQERLYKEVPHFERFFRIITENSLVAYQQRLMDSLSLTAEERYTNFCKKYPTLVNTLPAKQIASYIGVTPEFFSKMKHKLLKNS
jgi:CRP-like cAMP-binding protein